MVDVAAVPQGLVSGRPRWWGALLLAGCLSAGCVSFNDVTPTLAAKRQAPAPCQLVIHWHNDVLKAPDSTKGGTPTPVLVGRVYLFGQALATPLEADGGTVTVELFDPSDVVPAGTTGTPEGGPRRLEVWNIDPVTLAKFKRKDPVGWGYNLMLPWGTYRPELTRLQMRVCYKPVKGTPVYETGALVLGGTTVVDGPTTVSKNQQIAPPPAPGTGTAPSGTPSTPAAGVAALASRSPLTTPPTPASGTSPSGTLIAPGVRSWGSPALTK